MRRRCRLAAVPDLPPPVLRVVEAAERKGFRLDAVVFDQSTHTAAEAAAAVGAQVGQIVKSLVFVTEGPDGLRPCLVLASGANRVDLELLAAVLTEPHMRRASADEAHELTGYTIGGIPPFGHVRPIRTIMDPDLTRYDKVWAAAGNPNAVFAVAPATLRSLANAVVTPISVNHDSQQAQQTATAPIG